MQQGLRFSSLLAPRNPPNPRPPRNLRKSPFVLGALLLTLHILGLSGCAVLPEDPLTGAVEPSELRSHVNYLASPALKGRAPRTPGSWNSRRYIIDRFQAYGLKP